MLSKNFLCVYALNSRHYKKYIIFMIEKIISKKQKKFVWNLINIIIYFIHGA